MRTISSHHWHILGAGAIGTLIAFKLSQQQQTFSLMGRRHQNETRKFTDLQNVRHSLISVECEPIDHLIICTKSTQALHAFQSIQSRLHTNSLVICLFNGMGAQQLIQKSTSCSVFFATTTEGVSWLSAGHYGYKGAGDTYIDKAIFRCMPEEALSLLFRQSENINDHLLSKLIINSLINPLTVLFDCENGRLLTNAQAMATMGLLADEITLWLSIYQHHKSADELLELAVAVIRATASNSSSMRQDYKQKKISEIDFINGYWLSHNPKRLSMPENVRVVADVKRIEAGYRLNISG